ncbi:MAG: YidC/Oxa1 family membrane protein insertase [Candidatus Dormibacteraceae bacterium]
MIFLSSLSSFFDVFKPIKQAWDLVFVQNLTNALAFIYAHFQGVPLLQTIGAYGMAIIVLTIIIRVLLAPLQQFQLVTQRKSMTEQRKLAPQVAELRKKYKKDPQKLNAEMMKMYKEHGVNPLAGMIGCLPLVIQMPILTALYYVFTGFARSHQHVLLHFLFIPNVNDNPNHHLMFAGLPIPQLAYLVFPLLAALTTLVQSRMLQMPAPVNPTDQEAQTQQMQKTMVWLSPLMIGYFALNVPAGLGLYWFFGNCVSIIQQSFVVGWGNVLPARFRAATAGAPSLPPKNRPITGGKNGPPSGPRSGPKNGPATGPKNGPTNGSKPKKPNR